MEEGVEKVANPEGHNPLNPANQQGPETGGEAAGVNVVLPSDSEQALEESQKTPAQEILLEAGEGKVGEALEVNSVSETSKTTALCSTEMETETKDLEGADSSAIVTEAQPKTLPESVATAENAETELADSAVEKEMQQQVKDKGEPVSESSSEVQSHKVMETVSPKSPKSIEVETEKEGTLPDKVADDKTGDAVIDAVFAEVMEDCIEKVVSGNVIPLDSDAKTDSGATEQQQETVVVNDHQGDKGPESIAPEIQAPPISTEANASNEDLTTVPDSDGEPTPAAIPEHLSDPCTAENDFSSQMSEFEATPLTSNQNPSPLPPRAVSPDITDTAERSSKPRSNKTDEVSQPSPPIFGSPSSSVADLQIVEEGDGNENVEQEKEGTQSGMEDVAYEDVVEDNDDTDKGDANGKKKRGRKKKKKTIRGPTDLFGDFKCVYDECNHRSPSLSKLQQHTYNVHSGVDHCPACGEAFKNHNSTQTHVGSCETLKEQGISITPCPADEGCDKTFYSMKDLLKHLTNEHKEFDQEPLKASRKEYDKDEPVLTGKKGPNRKYIFEKYPGKYEEGPKVQQKRQKKRAPKTPSTEAPTTTSKKLPIIKVQKKSATTSQVENLRQFHVLMKDDNVTIVNAEDKSSFGYPGYLVIDLHQGGILNHFPAFITFIYQSEIANRGAVVVRPPSTFVPPTTKASLNEKLKLVRVYSAQAAVPKPLKQESLAFKLTYEDEVFKNMSLAEVRVFMEKRADSRITEEEHESSLMEMLENEESLKPYIQNLTGSLFGPNVNFWNPRRLNNDLTDSFVFGVKEKPTGRMRSIVMDGINYPQLYIGQKNTLIPLHKEDYNFGSLLYHHYGAPKVLYVVGPKYAETIEQKMAELCPKTAKICPSFLRHKMNYVRPELFEKWGISYNKVIIREGEFAVLAPNSYHEGFNLGFNVVESVNFFTQECVNFFLDESYTCFCRNHPLILPKKGVIQKYNPAGLDAYMNGELKWTTSGKDAEESKVFQVLNQEGFIKRYLEKHNATVTRYEKSMIRFDDMDPKILTEDDLKKRMLEAECKQDDMVVVVKGLEKDKEREGGKQTSEPSSSSKKRKSRDDEVGDDDEAKLKEPPKKKPRTSKPMPKCKKLKKSVEDGERDAGADEMSQKTVSTVKKRLGSGNVKVRSSSSSKNLSAKPMVADAEEDDMKDMSEDWPKGDDEELKQRIAEVMPAPVAKAMANLSKKKKAEKGKKDGCGVGKTAAAGKKKVGTTGAKRGRSRKN